MSDACYGFAGDGEHATFDIAIEAISILALQGGQLRTCALPQVSDPALLLLPRQVPHAILPLGARDAICPAGRRVHGMAWRSSSSTALCREPGVQLIAVQTATQAGVRTALLIRWRVRRSSAFYLAAISRPPKRSEERNATRYTLQTQNRNPEDTHELQSRALQVGPTPMTTSEMMTASSAGASPMLMGRSAKQRHSSVIAGSWLLSVAHHARRIRAR